MDNQAYRFWRSAAQCLLGCAALALLTFLCFRFEVNSTTVALLYLIVIVLLSLKASFILSAFVSIIAYLCLDSFFTAPLFRPAMSEPLDAVAPVAYLTTSLVITRLLSKVRTSQETLHKAQAELAHVTRVMAMGELASSIAHEINQPLAAIVNNGSACLRWLTGDSPNLDEAREAAQHIIRDGKRAGDVITRIRAILRKTGMEKTRLDVNQTIQEVALLLHNEAARKEVSLRLDLDDSLPQALGDRVQLQQVILNLVMNGIEAIAATTVQSRDLLVSTQQHEADKVLIAVRDSGLGIAQDEMEKVFDAFYTTKSQGLGMGLAISRTIVEDHGGRLWVVSNDGAGVTFQFTLLQHS